MTNSNQTALFLSATILGAALPAQEFTVDPGANLTTTDALGIEIR